MKAAHSFLRRSALFFYGTLFCIVMCAGLYLFNGNGQFTGSRSFWLNVFFVNYTFMGDAVFVLAVAAVIRFYYRDKEKSKAVFFTFLLTLLLIQCFKNIAHPYGFTIYFEESQYLFNSASLRETSFTQLPSGHTALAFSLAACLSSFTKRKPTQLLLLLGCSLLAFSRLYLAAHFLTDILTGILIGTASSLLVNVALHPKIINYRLEIRNEKKELNVSMS